MKLLLKVIIISSSIFFLVFLPHRSYAYSSGIAATVVTGQKDFVSSQANQGGSATSQTMSSPSAVLVVGSQLLVADSVNNRVLVYNNIPTSNNQAADLVIGQPDMSTTSSGCTQSKFNLGSGGGIFYNGGKLFVADTNNNRVLIFNSIPNGSGANANIVIGQSSFTICTANTGGASAKTLSSPTDITSDGSKLYIADTGNNRVLGYLSIPSSNNPSADVAIGQRDFVTTKVNTGGIGNITLNSPRGLTMYNGKLLISDTNNFRVVIFNTAPSLFTDTADVVIGQANFTSNSQLAVSSQSLQPIRLTVDTTGILYIADKLGNRILIFNTIPITNNTQANIVIGQQTFTASAANSGGISAATLSSPKTAFSTYSQLIVSDSVNNRVLIYPNTMQTPSINITGGAPGNPDGTVTVSGTATVSSPYTIQDVQFSANGNGWSEATSVNGGFKTTSEPFIATFDPTDNNNQNTGYTVKIRAIDSNGDVSPYAFFFSPFTTNAPEDNSLVTTQYPSFDFSVSTQRSFMKDNVQKYQIWVRKSGTANWQLYLDNIPSDFAAVKANSDNTKRSLYLNSSTNNGTYDNPNLNATYGQESSQIMVYAKEQTPTSFDQGGKALSGTYAWKVVAVDQAGHSFSSDSRYLRINSYNTIDQQAFFPLTILSITGTSKSNISSLHTDQIQKSYTTTSSAPVFYGIAAKDSTVTLTLTNSECGTLDPAQCSESYNTTTNNASRFGINIPENTLIPNVSYTVILSAILNEDYIELPQFSLVYSNTSQAELEANVMRKPLHTSHIQGDALSQYIYSFIPKTQSLLSGVLPIYFSH